MQGILHFDGLSVKNKSVISFSFVISRLRTEAIISYSNPIPDFLLIITGFCNYTYMLRFSFSVTLGCLYHRQLLMGFSSESFIPNSCSCPGQEKIYKIFYCIIFIDLDGLFVRILDITYLHNGMILSTLGLSQDGFAFGLYPKRPHTNGDICPSLYTHDPPHF